MKLKKIYLEILEEGYTVEGVYQVPPEGATSYGRQANKRYAFEDREEALKFIGDLVRA